MFFKSQIALELAVVIGATFALFLLNFPQMLELVDSYLHDFGLSACSFGKKVIIAGP